MAAPSLFMSLKKMRQFSRISSNTRGTLATRLQFFNGFHARGTTEGSLQDSGSHHEDPSPATASGADIQDEQRAKTIPISPERAHQDMLLLQKPDQPPDAHILKVSIIGSPNAGKSTLINSLLGQRICSVSSKVHTTRSNAFGVLTQDNTQIVLLDTPGMVNHKEGRKHSLARSLLIDPKNSLEDSDLALVLVDASNKWTREKISTEILMSLHQHPKISSILVLNKVDLISSKQELFSLTAQLTEGFIDSHHFTLDDKASRHLGKVETRPLMSHKYKPRATEAGEGGDSERTENVELQSVGNAADESDHVATSTSQDETDIVATGEDVTETVDCSDDHRHCGDAESNPASSGTQGSSSDTDGVELSSTLKEYISNLDLFSSKKDVDDEGRVHSVASAETETEKREERAERRKLLREMDLKKGWRGFEAVFMISALQGEGVDDVKEHLVEKAVPGDWEYHRDVITNLTPEEILREAIREKLLEYLPQEVPYNITQRNDLWAMEESGRLRILQMIICHKKSHVKLLKRNIGQIAREAEQAVINAFHCDVYLSLRIKLR